MTAQVEPRRPNQWWVGVVSGMASYIDSAAIVSFGIAIVIYQQAIGLTPGQVGILSGLLTFGIAVGALVGGRLGDRFGRRRVFITTMALIVVGGALLVLSAAVPLLVVGTLLVGLGTGADLPVSLSTISEAASDRSRGKLLGFSQILWFFGILVSILLGIVVGALGRPGGQILYGHVAVVALVVLLLRLTIPESRTWLDARAERSAGVATVRADRASALELFRGSYAVPFTALIVFYALVNLGANTFGQFGTFLLVNVAHTTVPTASLLSLALLPVGLVSGILFVAVADGRLRFAFFRIGAVMYVIGLAIPAILGFSVTTYVVSSILFSFGIGIAGEALMKVWSQRSFPTLLRTTAQGTIIAVARLVAAVLATVTPLVITGIGASGLYAALTVLSAIGLATAWVVFRRRDQHSEFSAETRLEQDLPATASQG